MNEPKIEIEFIPCPFTEEDERLRCIARMLVKDYLALAGNKELVVEDRFKPLQIEELFRGKGCLESLFQPRQL